MGAIIKFPKKKKDRKKLDSLLVEKLSFPEQHYNIGDVNFTCVECGNVSHFNFNNAIFKYCEFYCPHCGTGYKIQNPMFSEKPKNLKIK